MNFLEILAIAWVVIGTLAFIVAYVLPTSWLCAVLGHAKDPHLAKWGRKAKRCHYCKGKI